MKYGYLGVQSIYSHLHTLQYIHSFTYIAIYSIKRRFFNELTSVCRRRRLPCVCGKVAATEEEEAGSSGVDGGGGDRHERRRRRQRGPVK
jgi:hypothetical protein